LNRPTSSFDTILADNRFKLTMQWKNRINKTVQYLNVLHFCQASLLCVCFCCLSICALLSVCLSFVWPPRYLKEINKMTMIIYTYDRFFYFEGVAGMNGVVAPSSGGTLNAGYSVQPTTHLTTHPLPEHTTNIAPQFAGHFYSVLAVCSYHHHLYKLHNAPITIRHMYYEKHSKLLKAVKIKIKLNAE